MHKYYILAQTKNKKNNTRYFRVAEIESGKAATLTEKQIYSNVKNGEFSNANIDKLGRIRVYNKELKIGKQNIDIVQQLNKLMVGEPLRIRIKSVEWIQCIYAGKIGSSHYLFDNSGITGQFALSEQYINENKSTIQLDLENNDTVKVARLLEQFRCN